MAGIPKPTVEKSLVPWLNDCLNALAGLPAEHVLRFGHLWSGLEFHEQRLMASPRDVASWRQMSKDPDLRLVNLELMTTDVTRGRPFRFPLEPIEDDDSEQLWVCVDELRDGESPLFPESVLTALRQTESKKVQDRHGDERLLHKLPQPWDLPVIFAVRISMSLPALFQAIRMYRILQTVAGPRRSRPCHRGPWQTVDLVRPAGIRSGVVVLRRRHYLKLPGPLL